MEDQQSNIQANPKSISIGMNFNSVPSSIPNGMTSYALNALVENFDGNEVTYQNEVGSVLCATFPEGYVVVGSKNIIEDNLKLFWLTNPITGDCEIGKIVDCEYSRIINDPCLGFDVEHPILKIVYRRGYSQSTGFKNKACGLEVFWVNDFNRNRHLDLANLPFKTIKNGCDEIVTDEIDCNKMNIQPDYFIPQIEVEEVVDDGELEAGTYQFGIQYTNITALAFTSFYSITNPIPIFDKTKITLDFNYKVNKAIKLKISNLDPTGLYERFNLAVIKTVNNIPSVELVGTYDISREEIFITYTGQSKTDVKLSVEDIFAKYDIYKTANDITVAQDTLILADLTTQDRLSYQEIANGIGVEWQTWRMPKDSFANPVIATNLKSLMGDEVYPLEVAFLLKDGTQTDGFHIPGRVATESDLEIISNNDVININGVECGPTQDQSFRWKVYNTASVSGYEQAYLNFLAEVSPDIACYSGPFQYGKMAYWESTDVYPCNDIYGELSGKPIRHHKIPDSNISHIHDNEGFIYSKGVRVDIQQIANLIAASSLTIEQKGNIQGFKILRGNRANHKSIVAKGLIHNVGKYSRDDQTYFYPNYPYNDLRADPFLSTQPTKDDSHSNEAIRLNGFDSDDSRMRHVLHSPDTSFYQPTLGDILKLETAEYGTAKGHFQEVQEHSRYQFLTTGSYLSALGISIVIGVASATIGLSTNIFNGTAAFTAFQTYLELINKFTPHKNFAYQFNSIGEYDKYTGVPNDGNKQRKIDIGYYLQPGMVNVGDENVINNFQRESSVYIKTNKTLPFPNSIIGIPEDTSRYIDSQIDCSTNVNLSPILSYYASVKRQIDNQYGPLYSYETLDTGYQFSIDYTTVYPDDQRWKSIYGGDVFINRFAYKSKMPFFIDNRVGFPDDSDVEYNEIPNVAHPIFWMSTDSVADNQSGLANIVNSFFGRKLNNFDCPENTFFYQNGKFYLFSYGVPYFYTESEVNVDYRQAYNDSEGDFFPRIGSDIPDYWLQEINTSIKYDNTYHYNKTYSKQNKENFFSHIPDNWSGDACNSTYPFRVIFSENWYTFKPSDRFTLPQNYGSLISIDGIENKQVLVRFEQKPLLYNALLTAPTSQADVYLGQSLFSQQVPPLDYAEVDLGYIGCMHKFLLKTEYGDVTVDAKRGQVFLLNGNSVKELTGDTENQQMSKFFTEFLDFQILNVSKDINIDNHYNGIGLTGVYDSKYNRLILTKLDYKPLSNSITYLNGKFYDGDAEVQLTDTNYFCNYSFTISYDFDNQAWISFHSYIPNYYVGDANLFYAGQKASISSLWTHNSAIDLFNNYFGEIKPYIIEYSYSRQYNDEILQNIKDYSRVFQYNDWREFIQTDDDYFNKLIIYSNQQCSGILELVPKPKNNLREYSTYPIYNTDSKTITFTKSNSFYQINTFWDMLINPKQPIWKKSCDSLSIFKELNQDNMDYSKRSRKKSPFRSKDLKIRLILDDKDDIKIISGFTTTPTAISYK